MRVKTWRVALTAAMAATVMLAGCQQVKDVTSTAKLPPSNAEKATESDDGCRATSADLLEGVSLSNAGEKNKWQSYNWRKVWQKCPSSPVAAHNYIVSLMDSGDFATARQIAGDAAAQFSGFKELEVLAMRLNDPLRLAAKIADEKYKAWLGRKSSHTFALQPPQKEKPSPLPRLVKGEFEKRADFETRVRQAKEARRKELQSIEDRYAEAVARFNQEVKKHNRLVKNEKDQRLARRNEMRRTFLNQAINQVLGGLSVTDLVYDAEQEKFTGRLKARRANFDESVVIDVPLAAGAAKSFKAQADQLAPRLNYSINQAGEAVQNPVVAHNGVHYPMEFSEGFVSPPEVTAMASVEPGQSRQIDPLQEARESIAIEESYYDEALSIQDDPMLAELRQQKAENERKLKQAQAEKARERERQRIENAIRQQQQKLADLGGSSGREYEGLVEKYTWDFLPAREPAEDMLAVVIGNRSYGNDIPRVPYAYNDAKAVRDFLAQGMRVRPENIIFRRDATKGEMEGLFRRTLPNRVVRGKTDVLIYFSGHGMPKKGEALLLPADTRPEFADITGYPRDELLGQLAALDAGSTTVILDACFSGTAKDSAPLVAGKPVFAEVAPVAIPDSTVFIAATRAQEIARMDKEKGMSLMTFHLLQGLSGKADRDQDHAVSVAEIDRYLTTEVPRVARLVFNSEQTPEVYGPGDRQLVQY